MNTISLYLSCALSALLFMSASSAQQFGSKWDSVIYEARYIDRICPPEYPETRSFMEAFMQMEHWIGRFQEVFPDVAPESMADIRVLTDAEDAEACSVFIHRWERSINRQVRLFEGSYPYYLYDVTFYKGGDFYFVVVGGGFLIEEDPDGSGEERRVGGNSGIYIYDQRDFTMIDWEPMWRKLQSASPGDNASK